MGVLGLWQLLAPVGQPVSLESLENKIFAVDISIWLNQALKGYRDSRGGSVPNAHLMSLFTRLCKLMFYRIRPIIVFDGAVPELKKQTVINRHHRRDVVRQNTRQAGLKLLASYMTSQLLKSKKNLKKNSTNVVSVPRSKTPKDDIFLLPPLPTDLVSDDSERNELEVKSEFLTKDEMAYLAKIDIESEEFASLPPDIKLEILSTLKENRRHRSWEEHENLPDDSNDFSSYQLQCLLKRRNLQKKVEEVKCEMRKTSSADIISLYDTEDHVISETSRIMSEDSAHYILLKKVAKAPGDEVLTAKGSSPLNEEDGTVPMESDGAGDIIASSVFEDVNDVDFYSESKWNQNYRGTTTKTSCSSSFSKDIELEWHESDNGSQCTVLKMKFNPDNCFNSDSCDEIHNFKARKNSISEIEASSEQLESSQNVDVGKNTNEFEVPSFQSTASTEQPLSESLSSAKISLEGKASGECCSSSLGNFTFLRKENEVIASSVSSPNSVEQESGTVNLIDSSESKTSLRVPTHILEGNMDDGISPVQSTKISLEEKASGECCSSSPGNFAFLRKENEVIASSVSSPNSVEQESGTINLIDSSEFKTPLRVPTHSLEENMDDGISPIQSTIENVICSSDMEDASDEEACIALQNELEASQAALEAQRAKQQRQANTVQEHMYEECQELLQLFGVPYIISPTEAEAQCAYLDSENITHGTITDDSDIWLFGGKRVCKNFFSQDKFVEFFKDSEILSHFRLTRKKLINFALLTGSDYTEGIEGVGPVTAMEILSEFNADGFEAMCSFKEWWELARKHSSPPKNKVRAKLQKYSLSPGFPNIKVYEAYLNPVVDKSTESFTWGCPDLDALRDYTREKFGWNRSKVDDNLLPVIKRLNERTAQTHLDSFFTISLRKEKNLFPSKRIMSALKKIHSHADDLNSFSDDAEPQKKNMKKLKGKEVQKSSASRKSGKGKKPAKPSKGKQRKGQVLSKKVIPDAVHLSEESSSDSM